MKKVSFPREILALAAVGSAGVYFFFQAIVLVIFMVIVGNAPDVEASCWLLPLTLLALCLRLGARHRALGRQRLPARHAAPDRGHPHGLVLGLPHRVLLLDSISRSWAATASTWVYLLNPMTPLVLTFQRCIYAQPDRRPDDTGHRSSRSCRPGTG